MPHSIIAIDGPAASGKSSVARLLAQKLGFLFVSSGHFFRTIAWKAHHDQLDISDNTKVDDWLATFSLQSQIIAGEIHLLINGIDLTEYLKDSAVNRLVSPMAAIPSVRAFLLGQQRELARHHNLVMEGRDIGSVVFPETSFKFYLDASLEERARRRHCEGINDNISERDQQDSARAIAPLLIAPGAIVIDTTHLSIEEVVEEILRHVNALLYNNEAVRSS
ncbi:MAG: cytidylate kinase [Verrucomicrobia bacterium RIFCSPHIGHO2_12_FULL_41_10]|nr:MAG: cytidylate kinase [Verrucomicrobia bacterium RIFCSPHIGHO2_12_FULL_41_10]HLB33335.1 (d)CMP kinase [Chthoniobacterales bacterium]